MINNASVEETAAVARAIAGVRVVDDYPYVANSDFHKAKQLYSWKTLLKTEKNWSAIAATLRAHVDAALTQYRNGSWAA